MRNRLYDSSFAEFWEGSRSDYTAAKTNAFRRKRSGLPLSGGSGDWHYRSEGDWLRMLEWARDFERNDLVVGQGVGRVVSNVIRDGFKLDPQTGDAGADQALTENWDAWCNERDVVHKAQQLTFKQIVRIALRRIIVDGDVILLPNEDGSLETVEAHRLRKPNRTKKNVVHGVLLNDDRVPQEYWFTREDVDPTRTNLLVKDVERFSARDRDGHRQVFHLFNPQRFSQTRGITSFAPIFDAIGIHDDLQFAQLVKAQLAACFAILEEQSAGVPQPAGAGKTGEQTTETLEDGSDRLRQGVSAGMWFKSKNKLTAFTPNVPNAEFFKHAQMILTFIAVNLGIPVHVLLLDPSQTNFSGWRGAIDQARLGFQEIQSWLVDGLLREVYRWKVRNWIKSDLAFAAIAKRNDLQLFNHEWTPPAFPYIEPVKDATADIMKMSRGLASPRRVHGRNGTDWDREIRNSVDDYYTAIDYAMKRAQELRTKYPDDPDGVHWHELARLPSLDGIRIVLNDGNPSDEDNQSGDESSDQPGDKSAGDNKGTSNAA